MTFGPRTRRAVGLSTVVAAAATLAAPARAQIGTGTLPVEWLWPQIQARITLQTAALSPLGTVPFADLAPAGRVLQGAHVLGDFVLAARPGLGSLRATSGLLFGQAGGAPVSGLALAPRLSIGLLEGAAAPGEPRAGRAYLGLGYDSPALWGNLSIHADLGFAAAQWGGVGRALAGQSGWDAAVRELRLTPQLQLGLRFAF